MRTSILEALRPIAYDRNLFVGVATPKQQIVVRHTNLRTGPNDKLAYLLERERKLPAAVLVTQDGEPLQCFSTRYWARSARDSAFRSKLNSAGVLDRSTMTQT